MGSLEEVLSFLKVQIGREHEIVESISRILQKNNESSGEGGVERDLS